MDFLTILKQKSNFFYLFLIFLGLVKSVSTILILLFINFKVSGVPLPFFPEYDWAVFIVVIIISFVTTKLFQQYIIKLTNNIYTDFELTIFQKLRNSTFHAFERIGNDRIFTAIGDIRTLGNIPMVFMNIFTSSITVICCLSYLFWVTPQAGFVIIGFMIILLVIYLIRNKFIMQKLNQLRDLQNGYFQLIHDLLLGFRELKMRNVRSQNFHERHLAVNCNDRKRMSTETSISYMNNELLGSYAWYIILGVILFVLPLFLNVTGSDMTAYVITIFYLISPVAVLITLFPTLSNVKIATDRLEEFNYLIHQRMAAEEPVGKRPDFEKKFESIRFEDVTFEYQDDTDQTVFKFGPINLEIVKGEVVFITGGNGSGKSTFINLMTGLYKPSGGNMYFNDVKLDGDNYIRYREQISAIFTNNYIFQTNYDDFSLRNGDGDLIDLFHWMKLKDVVKIDDKKNFIDTRLSKGQQKRLALIYSLLEDRGIIVLDEWAAEQDPAFRSYFYNEILLTLQKEDRTIIAVTHDDHYFECADRVIKLDFGKVVSDVRKQVMA